MGSNHGLNHRDPCRSPGLNTTLLGLLHPYYRQIGDVHHPLAGSEQTGTYYNI
jgi:hypothetical protein